MPAKPKTKPSHDRHDGNGLTNHKKPLLIAAALVVIVVIYRRYAASASAAGSTVPVDTTTPVDTTLGGGSSGTTVGGVALASDGTPAIGVTDLANALSPFGDQLDNLQTEVDALDSVLTVGGTVPNGSGGTFTIPASPTGYAQDQPGFVVPGFSTDAQGRIITAADLNTPVATNAPLHLTSAPTIAATPAGAAPHTTPVTVAPSGPTKTVTVGKALAA